MNRTRTCSGSFEGNCVYSSCDPEIQRIDTTRCSQLCTRMFDRVVIGIDRVARNQVRIQESYELLLHRFECHACVCVCVCELMMTGGDLVGLDIGKWKIYYVGMRRCYPQFEHFELFVYISFFSEVGNDRMKV